MAFVLPAFNLTINIWHYGTWFGSFPGTIPVPDLTSSANLALGRRVTPASAFDMWLLLPPLTDIRSGHVSPVLVPQGDIVEVPAGTGRYYFVQEVDDIGKGFANEHRTAQLVKDHTIYPMLPPWPVPFP